MVMKRIMKDVVANNVRIGQVRVDGVMVERTYIMPNLHSDPMEITHRMTPAEAEAWAYAILGVLE